jgi:hypothetical protein
MHVVSRASAGASPAERRGAAVPAATCPPAGNLGGNDDGHHPCITLTFVAMPDSRVHWVPPIIGGTSSLPSACRYARGNSAQHCLERTLWPAFERTLCGQACPPPKGPGHSPYKVLGADALRRSFPPRRAIESHPLRAPRRLTHTRLSPMLEAGPGVFVYPQSIGCLMAYRVALRRRTLGSCAQRTPGPGVLPHASLPLRPPERAMV